MTEGRVFPLHRLPPGFRDTLRNAPDPPVVPRPSATLVLLREGPKGLEVLLLKRHPRSGFIPEAWVFPGGTLDPADGGEEIHPRIRGLTPKEAAERLRFEDPTHPAMAFWVAALRETFEETGILLHAGDNSPGQDALVESRRRLLAGECLFAETLDRLDVTLNAGDLAYCGFWVTPECEPRRYTTRFFAGEVGRDAPVTPHEKEMVDALWLTPPDALARNEEGSLPLVFPTLFTLEELAPFQTPAEALIYLRKKEVHRFLPSPEQTPEGIRFSLPG
jgi:8-oxo-dGTP pyrophosphatase MutT (NUDIX family)